MSNPLNIMQWFLFVAAVGALLFVDWKLAIFLLVVDGVIGVARQA